MAHADVAEGIEDALVGDDAVGGGKIAAQVCESVGHGHFLDCDGVLLAPSAQRSKAEWPANFKASYAMLRRPSRNSVQPRAITR